MPDHTYRNRCALLRFCPSAEASAAREAKSVNDGGIFSSRSEYGHLQLERPKAWCHGQARDDRRQWWPDVLNREIVARHLWKVWSYCRLPKVARIVAATTTKHWFSPSIDKSISGFGGRLDWWTDCGWLNAGPVRLWQIGTSWWTWPCGQRIIGPGESHEMHRFDKCLNYWRVTTIIFQFTRGEVHCSCLATLWEV